MESSLLSLITGIIFPIDALLSEDIQDSPTDCFLLKQAENKLHFPDCVL